MNPIELVVVVNTIRNIYPFRLAASLEPYPINMRVAVSVWRARQILATKRRQTDLVMLDLDLRSTLSVLESMDRHIPVVVFASTVAEDRRLASELGVVDYIEKPTNQREFVETVSTTLRQWAAEPLHYRQPRFIGRHTL